MSLKDSEDVMDSSAVTSTKSLSCHWLDCKVSSKTLSELQDHVLSYHLVENATSITMGFSCAFHGCTFVTRQRSQFEGHLKFHVYQQQLRSNVSCFLRKNSDLAKVSCSRPVRDVSHQPFFDGNAVTCCWESCQFLSNDARAYHEHVKSHCSAKTPVLVPVCKWKGCNGNEVFSSKRVLRQHLMNHHSGEKAAACWHCNAVFVNLTKFRDHLVRQQPVMAVNNNEGDAAGLEAESDESATQVRSSFTCNFCHKAFASARLLDQHVRHHVFHYKCELCGMSAESPSLLRRHVEYRHFNERPFLCAMCSKGFKELSDLKTHMKNHEVHQYVCNVCQAKFSWKHTLTNHMRTKHANLDKPRVYACHLCSETFDRGPALGTHLIKLHQVRRTYGQTRFGYKRCADGYFRCQMGRFEILYETQREESGTTPTINDSAMSLLDESCAASDSLANLSKATGDAEEFVQLHSQAPLPIEQTDAEANKTADATNQPPGGGALSSDQTALNYLLVLNGSQIAALVPVQAVSSESNSEFCNGFSVTWQHGI